MFNWFRHKEYPDFWNAYTAHFNNKLNIDVKTTRFVVFDTETTGLNPTKDRLLSIGAVSLKGNIIAVANSFEKYIAQDTYSTETVKIHGILKEGNLSKIEEKEAIIDFLDYIKDAVLVAHHAAFDIAIINEALKRLGLPKLKNRHLDTGLLFKRTTIKKNAVKHYGLDELCAIFNIAKHDRHTASGDAYITALLFLKIMANLRKVKNSSLNELQHQKNRNDLL